MSTYSTNDTSTLGFDSCPVCSCQFRIEQPLSVNGDMVICYCPFCGSELDEYEEDSDGED